MSRLGTGATSLVVGMLACMAAHAGEPDWAAAARADIESVYATLRDNHPGPVDPLNRQFAQWLEEGRAQALSSAATARTQADYWRAVRAYTNGFRDGHIWFGFANEVPEEWPGFLTRRDDDGRTRVVVNDGEPELPLGAELLSCDGTDVTTLHKRLVDPYLWNADIPHHRDVMSTYLMTVYDGDNERPRACRFKVGERDVERTLRWSRVSGQQLGGFVDRALGQARSDIGLRKVGDVWFVSMPTFNLDTKDLRAMRTLLKDIKKRIRTLREAPWVVLDVRGNTGGNSGWGSEIARALYGAEVIDRIEGQFDWTVDWRASQSNAAGLREQAARSRRDGQQAEYEYRSKLAEDLEQATREGRELVRRDSPPSTAGEAIKGPSPFRGRVFLLTDTACASACLDFADIARRLPGVVHVGQPTFADSIYIDNTETMLPSGHGQLSYSLKVYRNRIRGNNQWYEPAVRWPGGVLTDQAVAAWIKSLDSP